MFELSRMFQNAASIGKSSTLILSMLTAVATASAQNDPSTVLGVPLTGSTYGEFKSGYGITHFQTGLEERFDEGNFSTSGGGLFSVAAYRTFKKADHVHFGLKFKALGATPSEGEGDEEMFFNFWGAAVSMKYFPFSSPGTQGFYLQGDFNFVTQFTQKYRKQEALVFDHLFAIGRSFTCGLGHQHPLKEH